MGVISNAGWCTAWLSIDEFTTLVKLELAARCCGGPMIGGMWPYMSYVFGASGGELQSASELAVQITFKSFLFGFSMIPTLLGSRARLDQSTRRSRVSRILLHVLCAFVKYWKFR